MYVVKLDIYSDGDFGFDDTEFRIRSNAYGERFFYFEHRKDAADAIVRFFHNFRETYHTSKTYLSSIKDWIDLLDSKIELITKKLSTFMVAEDFGNQEIHCSLLYCEQISMPNGGCTYIIDDSDAYDFRYIDLKDEVDWKLLEKCADVKEGE